MRSARMDLACASLVMFFSSNAGSKSGSAAVGLAASSPLMVPLWTTGRASSLWRWRPWLVRLCSASLVAPADHPDDLSI